MYVCGDEKAIKTGKQLILVKERRGSRLQSLKNYRQIVLREKVCKRCAFAGMEKELIRKISRKTTI